jgi:hypothetical protein
MEMKEVKELGGIIQREDTSASKPQGNEWKHINQETRFVLLQKNASKTKSWEESVSSFKGNVRA